MHVSEEHKPVSVAPPRGIFQARCDDKGRLKLPAAFVEYLKKLGVEKVFITTTDTTQAQIYTEPVWESNLNFLDNAGENADIAEDVAFIANLYGADSEIDAQGRVLVPTDLRRKLEIENAPVWLDFYNSRINVFGKKVYEERLNRATVDLAEKVKTLKKKGFK
jgi:MraZ protein